MLGCREMFSQIELSAYPIDLDALILVVYAQAGGGRR
jgi:hypothetical protein